MSTTISESGRQRQKLKVRTGCITCKIRKVKCDEAKPNCKRCTDTGRKCDGYAATEKRSPSSLADQSITSLAHKRSLSSPKETVRPARRLVPAQIAADAAFLSPALSGEDGLWIEFFSMHTGPALSNVFSHSFWSFTLPQLSISQPAIRHALIALGSAHAQFEAAATKNSVLQITIDSNFILRHYNQAIKHLKTRLEGDAESCDVALLCCLMFISLECLYGNRMLVIDHLQNGLNILRYSKLRDMDLVKSSNANARSIIQEVSPLFHQLDSQTTLMGYSACTLFNHLDQLLALSVPRIFTDFEHAKSSLDTLIASTLGFIRNIHDGKHAGDSSVSLSARTVQIHLLSEFAIWNNSMVNLVESCHPLTDEDNRLEKSFRVQHTASFIWLSRCTELDECGFDSFHAEFASIVRWSRILTAPLSPSEDPCLNARLASLSLSKTTKWSLGIAYIPPLYLVAIKCRDPLIRREAITILEETNAREGLWDAHLHAVISKRYLEIEETGALVSEGAQSAYMEPGPLMRIIADGEVRSPKMPLHERFRVYDAEIRDVTEGMRGTCQVTFRTSKDGLPGDWTHWTETMHF